MNKQILIPEKAESLFHKRYRFSVDAVEDIGRWQDISVTELQLDDLAEPKYCAIFLDLIKKESELTEEDRQLFRWGVVHRDMNPIASWKRKPNWQSILTDYSNIKNEELT